LGILLLADKYAQPWFGRHLGASYLADIALAIVTITVLAPFLWALALRKIQPEAVNSLGTDKRHKGPLLMLQLLRFALALFFIGMLINNLLSSYAAIGALVLVLATFVLNQKVLQSLFNRIESRFISNYNDKE